MFKVNNKDTRTTPFASFWCLYCQLWTYFTLCSSVSIVNFEHVIAGWVIIHLWFSGFWEKPQFFLIFPCLSLLGTVALAFAPFVKNVISNHVCSYPYVFIFLFFSSALIHVRTYLRSILRSIYILFYIFGSHLDAAKKPLILILKSKISKPLAKS